MPVSVRSFAKINLGLCIGPLRADGFHDLRTVYQTIALHDIVRVQVVRGTGIEIRCAHPRVPCDPSNTCYRMVERTMAALKAKGRVVVEIEKRLPVQGGLGGASANAVATLLGLERAVKKQIPKPEKLQIAAEVGSDLPLFLVGGTVLGSGRGEEVYPLPDFPQVPLVIVTPEIGVSTPKAFADWDSLQAGKPGQVRSAWTAGGGRPYTAEGGGPYMDGLKLTASYSSVRMSEFGRTVSAWLSGVSQGRRLAKPASGVPAKDRGRAEILLLDLVRTGIENDFEKVVFPQHPELRDVKRALERAGADYASLSGSGSAVYGLFRSSAAAGRAAARLNKSGVAAQATSTIGRDEYWRKIFD
jgi:4-diphosphocytidyl-2-C-methyl-D-erythritol kinase